MKLLKISNPNSVRLNNVLWKKTFRTISVTCPECWQLNADKTACEISDNTCFEISCDGARLSFAFLPKMFGIDDLSHNFGVIGLEKNEDLQKYEYSRGFGNNGQDRA